MREKIAWVYEAGIMVCFNAHSNYSEDEMMLIRWFKTDKGEGGKQIKQFKSVPEFLFNILAWLRQGIIFSGVLKRTLHC